MKIDGIWCKDQEGRSLILRGANLGGSSKVPFQPDGATYRCEHFFESRNVSFVGRPFPLNEADEHFSRLQAWGFNILRLLITWEAVEHSGPEQYDEAYLDYIRAIVKKAGEYDLDVFIDPHQDVWSRWTGGDGAPGWTLEAIGMDLNQLHTTAAAITHQTSGDPLPRMIWPSNYTRLGAATLFTLFFGGNDFMPTLSIDGIPVQEYLQSHYINAIKQVAKRLNDLNNVIGYDSLNEPSAGFLGVQDVTVLPAEFFLLGPTPTPYQAMLLAAGYPQDVAVYTTSLQGPQQTGTVRCNPSGGVLWKSGYECIFKQNGIWTDEEGSPRLLRPNHFARRPDGSPIDPVNDYLKPFILRFIREIREVNPRAFLFLEGVPNGKHPDWETADPPNAVNAAHWYDNTALLLKTFDPDYTVDMLTHQSVTGAAAVQAHFTRQIAAQKHASIPTLIGEFGLPFDLNDKSAYQSGDFSSHISALDMYYNALDANLLNCTIWNYTADNNHAHGDNWNDEDLSIFSRDQQDKHWRDDINAGGRGLPAIVRPYARKTAGEPLYMHFDRQTRRFAFAFRHDPAVSAPSEIFVPTYQYPNGIAVELSDGTYTFDPMTQTLIVRHTTDRSTHTVKIVPKQ